MRIVRTPTGEVILDESGRAAGRGAYVCRKADCLETSIAKSPFGRALKTPLSTDQQTALGESLTNLNQEIEGGARGKE